ncbi:MAG: ankyrin repeat domain-containing protein [Armatimonadota bacterium]
MKRIIPIIFLLLLAVGIIITVKAGTTHKASWNGNVRKIKNNLKASLVPANKTDSENTPLINAVKDNHISTIKQLLAEHPDLSACDKKGNTPLHLVKSKEAALLLIKSGARMDLKNYDGETPLFGSVTNIEAAKLLITSGADINAKDDLGFTILADAVHTASSDEDKSSRRNASELIKYLLTKDIDVNAQSNEGYTALECAASHGCRQMEDILLNHGAKINIADETGWTALHYSDDDKQNVEYLIRKGADISAKTDDGDTPLHVAAERSENGKAAVLLIHKADVNARDSDGNTPLHLALANGNEAGADLLKSHGANIQAKNNKGEIPHAYKPSLLERLVEKLVEGR